MRCAETGCRDTILRAYATQREYADLMREQQRRPYKCTRHRAPEEVLRPDNLERQQVLTASRIPFRSSRPGAPEWLPGLFWLEEGKESGSGFAYGPGFKAHASDFPEGTRLVVTARVEVPKESTDG